MLRTLLCGAALSAALVSGMSSTVSAQPPSPQEVVRKIDHGVRRAVTNTDRAVRRTVHPARHHARHVTYRTVRVSHRSVRALCNDGRLHTGRTRASACASHGGFRG